LNLEIAIRTARTRAGRVRGRGQAAIARLELEANCSTRPPPASVAEGALALLWRIVERLGEPLFLTGHELR
jgi:hypothetical protein